METWCWLLTLVCACGGEVVVDGGDGGSAPGGTLCERACAAIDTCLDEGAGCVASCSARTACGELRDAFLSCYVDATSSDECTMPPECVEPLIDAIVCEGRVPDTIMCSGGTADECSCYGTQFSGESIEAYCQGGGGTSGCQCFVDGETVGSCNHPGPAADACDIALGCCAGLLFIP